MECGQYLSVEAEVRIMVKRKGLHILRLAMLAMLSAANWSCTQAAQAPTMADALGLADGQVPDSAPVGSADATAWFAPKPDPQCVDSPCWHNGKCHWAGPPLECVETPESCLTSALCLWDGMCWVYNGLCDAIERPAAPCATSKACEAVGWCHTLQDGRCRPGSDADCQNSQACQSSGACSYADGVCAPTTQWHCAHSSGCSQAGRCYWNGKQACVVHTQDDCAASQGCALSGECTLSKDGVCTAPPGTDCSATPGCAAYGWCKLGNTGQCRADSVADCLKSTACKLSGACAYSVFGCINPAALYKAQ